MTFDEMCGQLIEYFPPYLDIVGGDTALENYGSFQYAQVSDSGLSVNASQIYIWVKSTMNMRGTKGIYTDLIDFTGFNKMIVQFDYSGTNDITPRSFCVAIATNIYNSQDSNGDNVQFVDLQAYVSNTNKTKTVDISAITGEYRVYMYVQTAHAMTHSITIKKLRFEA